MHFFETTAARFARFRLRRFDNFDPAEYQLVLPEEDEQLNPLAGPVRRTELGRKALAVALEGVVQGSPLGLEIDVSTSGRVQDTLRRFEPRLRHFWTRRGVF